jgi:hypothetical protein
MQLEKVQYTAKAYTTGAFGLLDTVGECVPGTRKMTRIERDAALEMEDGPPKSVCRGGLQTAVSCVG